MVITFTMAVPLALLYLGRNVKAQAYCNLGDIRSFEAIVMPICALLFLLSLVIYGLAQALPCLSFISVPTALALKEIAGGNMSLDAFDNIPFPMSGFELTLYGGLALILFWQISAIGWLANPLYWCSALLFSQQKYKGAAIVSVLAVVVGGIGTTLAFHYMLPTGSSPYSSFALQSMLPGFWLWFSAPIMMATSSVLCLFRAAN